MDETLENNQDQVFESNQLRSAFEGEAIGMRFHDNSILTRNSFIWITMVLICDGWKDLYFDLFGEHFTVPSGKPEWNRFPE